MFGIDIENLTKHIRESVDQGTAPFSEKLDRIIELLEEQNAILRGAK